MSLEQKIKDNRKLTNHKPTYQLQPLDFLPIPGFGLLRFGLRNRKHDFPITASVEYFTNMAVLLVYNSILTVAPLYVMREYFI